MMALLMMIMMVLDVHTHTAAADDDTVTTDPTDGVTLTIDAMTPIITTTSGFSATLTIANHTDAALDDGDVDILTNPDYNFVSRTDVQEWADADAHIDTPLALAHVDVTSVPAQGSVSAHVRVDAHDGALAALTTWGPRPLRILYNAQGASATLNTYITRAQDGVDGVRTPSIGMSVVMPLTSHDWKVDTKARRRLISSAARDDTARSIATLDEAHTKALHDKDQLATNYPHLQVVVDPAVLDALGTPHLTALMQPARFDITTYARMRDADAYADAGVSERAWSADSALTRLRRTLGDTSATAPTVAWQGADSWTIDALDAARAQGYDTVIATDDFDVTDDATAETLVYRTPTGHGDVTVLAAQPTLTALANARPSSAHANAEQTDAGRIARFLAQSAFYQMEQPYEERTLLVCFGDDVTPGEVSALMDTLNGADWLDMKTLDDLAQHEPLVSSDLMPQLINANVGVGGAHIDAVRETLEQLGASRTDLMRLASSILARPAGASGQRPDDTDADDPVSPSVSASASAAVSTDADTANGANGAGADRTDLSETAYARRLLDAHDTLALFALQGDATLTTAMRDAAHGLADAALGEITLIPSGNVNVLSESASMPVTVSNKLPFPIAVRVSSRTDSIEIVTARVTDVHVPAHSETQASISIRVTTSGTTMAREQLFDRDNKPFGAVQQTSITSSLQLSDKSGLAIVIIAAALGLLGLWRQFHRKKDPDE
ncbi:DUF6049 family protein [Bifidobacterium criceti]|uniref:Secreted protein n=1 Tax=Bifidobacterium criceti TaxID=1960969 RepID=A0A2A2EJF6_9BIFI|nr:DUF6049 family protein [Bifidobacterium criceti]PAU69048.1 hypothetical protein B1526_0029 [Bifidobacterium criceti]